ncbi:MAG: glycosyl transferase family 2 [Thermoplasmata archaeon]|nr:MAG: glycosyl transferase family 2 [Thermoplasmata archaeon]
MMVSIVITVKNESDSIAELLDSLLIQERPFEIIVVDANSTDNTQDIVRDYEKRYKEVKLLVHGGSRGEGRNFGVSKAKGEIIAFTDGGCKADRNWLKELKKKISEGFDVVAGKTIDVGPFQDVIERVKIEYKGYDITFPSCNLAYKRELFEKIGGFDTRLITAEDIDLNLRAVDVGAKIGYNENAIIYRRTAEDIFHLIKQSFWYGYGRKQLTLKHGELWKYYSAKQTFLSHKSLVGTIRLVFGLLGYLICMFTGGGMED